MYLGRKSRRGHKHGKMERLPNAEAEIAGGPLSCLSQITAAARRSPLLGLPCSSSILSLQASFGSRDSSATIQGYNCLANLHAAGPFLGVQEKVREAGPH